MPGRVKELEMLQIVVVTMHACSWFAHHSSLRKGLKTAVCRGTVAWTFRGTSLGEKEPTESNTAKPSSDDP